MGGRLSIALFKGHFYQEVVTWSLLLCQALSEKRAIVERRNKRKTKAI